MNELDTIAGQMEFTGSTSFSVSKTSTSALEGQAALSWEFLSTLVDNYLKTNRGRKINPEHYRSVVRAEIERMILAKAEKVGRDVLNVDVELPKDFGLQSKSVNAQINLDWFPELPALNTEGLKIEQFKLESYTKEEIDEMKDKFLDSNRIPIEWDGPIEKGDIVRVFWSWKIDNQSDWSEDSQDESSTVVKVGVNPRLDPALEAKLIGSKKGDAVEHEVKVPANINEGSLNPQFSKYIKEIVRFAGKSIMLRMQVLDVQRPEKPTLDESLLKKYNLESEEALEKKITENLDLYKTTQNTEASIAQILDHLRTYKVEYPERYAADYANVMLEKFANLLKVPVQNEDPENLSETFKNNFMKAISDNIDELKMEYETFDAFKAKLDKVATEVVSGNFMITQVAKTLGISEQELQTKTLQAWIGLDQNTRKQMQEHQVREYFMNTRHRIILTKLLDSLKEKEQVETKEVKSLKEFEKSVISFSDNSLHTRYFTNKA